MSVRLIIEVNGLPKDERKFTNAIIEMADSKFEDMTMDGAQMSFMRSWIVKPSRDGKFK